MTTHEVLVKARNLLERDWAQAEEPGGAMCGIPGYCAHTGISYITKEDTDWRAQEVLCAILGIKSFGSVPDMNALFLWNDDPQRTKAEVLAAFDHPPGPHPLRSGGDVSQESKAVLERLTRTTCPLYTSEIEESTALGSSATIEALCELEEHGFVEPASWRATELGRHLSGENGSVKSAPPPAATRRGTA